jgi:hypothetical protein
LKKEINQLLVPSVTSLPASDGRCISASKLISRKVHALAQMKFETAF